MLMILGNDIAPQTSFEITYCIILIYFGAFLIAFIFGQIATITAESNKNYDFNVDNLMLVNNTMISKCIDEGI